MYELFGIVGSWKLIDLSIDEKNIVDSLIDCEKAKCSYNYLIHNTNSNKDIRIKNKNDFIIYLKDYKERHTYQPIEDKSCLELKREILDLYDKSKARK